MPEPRASATGRSSDCPKTKNWTGTRTAPCGPPSTRCTSWGRCSFPPTTSASPVKKRRCAASSSLCGRQVTAQSAQRELAQFGGGQLAVYASVCGPFPIHPVVSEAQYIWGRNAVTPFSFKGRVCLLQHARLPNSLDILDKMIKIVTGHYVAVSFSG